MNHNGAIQRAELFANVDELMQWKRSFERKQVEMIQWQAMVMESIQSLRDSLETTLKGCSVLVECDTTLGDRIDNLSTRIDIANKRLRKLETLTKKLPIVNEPSQNGEDYETRN